MASSAKAFRFDDPDVRARLPDFIRRTFVSEFYELADMNIHPLVDSWPDFPVWILLFSIVSRAGKKFHVEISEWNEGDDPEYEVKLGWDGGEFRMQVGSAENAFIKVATMHAELRVIWELDGALASGQ